MFKVQSRYDKLFKHSNLVHDFIQFRLCKMFMIKNLLLWKQNRCIFLYILVWNIFLTYMWLVARRQCREQKIRLTYQGQVNHVEIPTTDAMAIRKDCSFILGRRHREDAYSRTGSIFILDTAYWPYASLNHNELWFNEVWPYASLNHNEYAVSRMKMPPVRVREYASSLITIENEIIRYLKGGYAHSNTHIFHF